MGINRKEIPEIWSPFSCSLIKSKSERPPGRHWFPKVRSTAKLSEARRNISNYFTRAVVSLLAKTRVTPNAISWSGFFVTIGAAVLIIQGYLFTAGFVALAAGFFDLLDGALARGTNQVTKFGAVLDATLDRLAEAVLLLSVLFVYIRGQSIIEALVVAIALAGSLLVSYVRARAEAAGLECRVGFFTRAERVVVLALGLLLSQINYALIFALGIIAVLSLLTVAQRITYVWRQTKLS